MAIEIEEYKVIADFPASMHKVGDLIKVYAGVGRSYVVEINDTSEKVDVRDYPHLFELVK